MKWRLLAVIGSFLNAADAAVTPIEILRGLATEANPLMAFVLAHSVLFFVLAKVAVCGAFYFMSAHTDLLVAKIGIAVGVLAYAIILAIHIIGLMGI